MFLQPKSISDLPSPKCQEKYTSFASCKLYVRPERLGWLCKQDKICTMLISSVLRLVHRLYTRKMKTSIAALPFLILAAQAALEDMMSNLKFELSSLEQNHHSLSQGGFHRPTDCCMSYTPRNIRCVFMENYIETSSACSRPAVIFMTKKGQRVCADPNNEGVQKCKSELRLGSAVEDLRSLLLERGRLDRAPSTPSLLPHHPHWRAVA